MDRINNAYESTLVALAGLDDDDVAIVRGDEGEYVFVAGDDAWDDDESSYDHCELLSALSCAASIATNVTLEDLDLVDEPRSDAATTSRRRLSNKKLRKRTKASSKKSATTDARAETAVTRDSLGIDGGEESRDGRLRGRSKPQGCKKSVGRRPAVGRRGRKQRNELAQQRGFRRERSGAQKRPSQNSRQ